MGQLPPGAEADYAALFAEPSIERMVNGLTDHQFEHFAKYVFEQAGYYVEDTAGQVGQGLDLKLCTGPAQARLLYAGVSVKHFRHPDLPPPHTHVQYGHVTGLKGALTGLSGVSGYVVTSSIFTEPALKKAREQPQIWPIDGKHLVRYINYVRGSRIVEAEDTEPDVRLRGEPLAPVAPEVLLAADDIVRRPQREAVVLALANNKGGVGKTTTALNLAFALAGEERGQQVLIVDLDPQANLTKLLPSRSPNGVQSHIGDYFAGRRKLPELIRETQFDRVWLIPSANALGLLDRGLSGPETVLRFVRDLHAADVAPPEELDTRSFDWIIIDTGPSMGMFTRSALAASHYVLMPISPGVFADMGEGLLRRTIATMEELIGEPITLLGGIVTQWKKDALHTQLLAKVRESLPILEPNVPYDKTNIEKAHVDTYTKRKMLFDRRCEAARAYLALVDEVQRRVQSQREE